MICENCGFENESGVKFCVNCGMKINVTGGPDYKETDLLYDSQDEEYEEYGHETFGKSRKGIIIALSALLAVALIVLIVLIIGIYNDKNMPEDKAKTESTEAAETDSTAETADSETTETFNRYSTYSSDYTYKDMPDIYYSEIADDSECFEMEALIKKFNQSWVDYVNNGDNTVFKYLRTETKAYQYAINFGNKDVYEAYETIDVNDVRVYGNNYYVWVYEVINKTTSEGTNRAVYHWVYKIGKDSEGYYVENYRSDPYYS